MFDRKKGAGGYILLIGVILGIFAASLIGYTAYSQGSFTKVNRIWDISTTLNSGILGSFFENHYLEQSLRYSLWQSSYDLGRRGGGFPIWVENNIPTRKEVAGKLEDRASNSSYRKNFTSSRCKLEWGEPYNIYIEDFYVNDSFAYEARKEPIKIRCSRENVQSTYLVDTNREGKNPGNRFFYLWNDSFEVVNGSEFRLDKIEDPSGYYWGAFAGPSELKCLSGSGADAFKEMTGCTESEAPDWVKATARIIAELIAESDYRSKIVNRYEEAKKEANITDETSFKLENKGKLLSPDLGKDTLYALFPDMMSQFGNLRAKLKSHVEKAREAIHEAVDAYKNSVFTGVPEEAVKNIEKALKPLEKIKGILNNVRNNVKNFINNFEWMDQATYLKNSGLEWLEENIEKIKYDKFVQKKKEDWKQVTEDYGDKAIEAINNPINDYLDNIDLVKPPSFYLSSKESLNEQKHSIRLQDEGKSKEEIKEKVGNIIDDTDLTSILTDQFSQEMKEVARREIRSFLHEKVKDPLLDEGLKEAKSQVKEALDNEVKDPTKEMIRDKFKKHLREPAKRAINKYIRKKLDKALDGLLDEIVDKIEKKVDEGIELETDTGVSLEKLVQEATKSANSQCGLDISKIPMDKIKKVFKNNVKDYIEEGVEEGLQNALDSLKKQIKENIKDKVADRLDKEVDKALDKLEGKALDKTENFYDSVEEGILNFLDNKVKGMADWMAQQVENELVEISNQVAEDIAGQIKKEAKKYATEIKITESLKPLLKTAANKAIDGVYNEAEGTSFEIRKETREINLASKNEDRSKLKDITQKASDLCKSLDSNNKEKKQDYSHRFSDKLKGLNLDGSSLISNWNFDSSSYKIENCDEIADKGLNKVKGGKEYWIRVKAELKDNGDKKLTLKLVKSIEERIKEGINEKVEKKIQEEAVEPINDKIDDLEPIGDDTINNIKKSFKDGLDTAMEKSEIMDKVKRLKDEAKEAVNEDYEKAVEDWEEAKEDLKRDIKEFEFMEPVNNVIDNFDQVVDKALEDAYSLLGEEDKAFQYHFFDYTEVLDVTVPVPCAAICAPTLLGGPGAVAACNQVCPADCALMMKLYVMKTKIDPEDARLKINSTDQKYVLPVEQGYKNLNFNFTYHYSFEKTK